MRTGILYCATYYLFCHLRGAEYVTYHVFLLQESNLKWVFSDWWVVIFSFYRYAGAERELAVLTFNENASSVVANQFGQDKRS